MTSPHLDGVPIPHLDDEASLQTRRVKRLKMLKFMSKARKDGLSFKV